MITVFTFPQYIEEPVDFAEGRELEFVHVVSRVLN